jgi:hypothetical protein
VTPAALALAALLAAPAEPEPARSRVTLVAASGPIALSAAEEADLAQRVEAVIVGCAITSVGSPEIFAARSPAREWEEARAGAHLHVRFPRVLRTRRTGIPITEAVVGLRHPSFIGPELSRHGDQVVGHTKCDGHRSLALMCAPAVRPHLLPGQRESCGAYDAVGEPRAEE